MTKDEFTTAKQQLIRMSVAVQERERFMRHAMAFYAAGNYEWAMGYQFMFLLWQDEVRRLSDESVGGPGHHLWFRLGGRP